MSDHALPSEASLHAQIDHRLENFRDRLAPRLRSLCDEFFDRLDLGLRPKGAVREGSSTYFINPLALPVLQLPLWAGARTERAGRPLPEEVVLDLVESAAVGYLHVRIQDDLLDEGVGRPGEAMLLAEAFFLRHQTLLARRVGHAGSFWERCQSRWLAYGDAMLLEQELMARKSGLDESAFDRILRRSQPLELPAAAVLEIGGLPDLFPHLADFVRLLVRGHQLFHDLIDADKDLGMGNMTFVVQRLGGNDGSELLHRRMLLEGGFDEVTDEALSNLVEAEEAARRAGLDEAAEYVVRRRELMEKTRREVFESLFRRILAKSAGTH